MKTCKKCGETKPLDRFNRAASTKDGRRGECKTCSAAMSQKWREDHPRRWMAHYHRRRYSLSPEQFDAMLLAQDGVCAICKRPETKRASLSVDHDHTCCPKRNTSCGGCIRGLLCSECNRGLAAFADDPERIKAAADYLARTR